MEEGPLRVTNLVVGLGSFSQQVEVSPDGNFWLASGSSGTWFVDTSTNAVLNVNSFLGAASGPGILAPSRSDTESGVFNTVSTSSTTPESFFVPTNPVGLPISLGATVRNGILADATSDG